MLEEGEIDEEDLETQAKLEANSVNNNNNTNGENTNNLNENELNENEKSPTQLSKTSANMNLNNNKRKNRDGKINKRKKLAKNGTTAAAASGQNQQSSNKNNRSYKSKDGVTNNDMSDDEDQNDSENSQSKTDSNDLLFAKNDYDSRFDTPKSLMGTALLSNPPMPHQSHQALNVHLTNVSQSNGSGDQDERDHFPSHSALYGKNIMPFNVSEPPPPLTYSDNTNGIPSLISQTSLNSSNNPTSKYQSLMSTSIPHTSSWSTPLSKKEKEQTKTVSQPTSSSSSATIPISSLFNTPPPPLPMHTQSAPKSLFDLFISTGSSLKPTENKDNDLGSTFIDPVITEKENNKPKFNNSSNSNSSLAIKLMNNSNQSNKTNQSMSPSGWSSSIGINMLDLKRKDLNNDSGGMGMGMGDDSEKLISIESIEKKMEKKRKYMEIAKEKQKRDAEKQAAMANREPILCKFFAEGRCQKGDDCPFSHNIQLNKKLEICKYYLIGFCSKNDKCLYMHSEFPCKFYHRKNIQNGVKKFECVYGDSCRFSHEPITNPLVLEAFEKYLGESEDASNKKQSAMPNANNESGLSSSLIPSLMDISVKPAHKPAQTNEMKPSSPMHPSSPPSSSNLVSINPLMSTNLIRLNQPPPPIPTNVAPPYFMNSKFEIKKPPYNIPPPPIIPSIKNPNPTSNSSQPPFYASFQDIDERAVPANPTPAPPPPLISTNIPLTTIPTIKKEPTTQLIQSKDIDERSIGSAGINNFTSNAANNVQFSSIKTEPKVPSSNNDIETVKEQLIIKIMKAISDDDGGVFSQIPKQTLTELLVKLLNKSSTKSDFSSDALVAILATLTNASSSNSVSSSNNNTQTSSSTSNKQQQQQSMTTHSKQQQQQHQQLYDNDDDKLNGLNLNESSSSLQIDFDQRKQNVYNKKFDDGVSSDYDDDYDERDDSLVIEGHVGEIPYKLIEIDIEPSKLWTNPPVADYIVDGADQECDPRIKYYSNKSNLSNVANFQLHMLQQNQLQQLQQMQQMTPTSPSTSSSTGGNQPQTTSLTSSLNSQSSASSPSGPNESSKQQQQQQQASKSANRIVDPRLVSRTNQSNNLSPTHSSNSPPQQDQFGLIKTQQTDLISIQNRQLANNSLLSALPDLPLPKDTQSMLMQSQKNSSFSSLMSQQQQQQQQQQQNDTNIVKLSIEDYKRKLQKPSNNFNNSNSSSNLSNLSISNGQNSLASSGSSSTQSSSSSSQSTSISSSLLSSFSSTIDFLNNTNSSTTSSTSTNSSSTNSSSSTSNNQTSSLPSIPSYSVNLQAPQSLHELLRNFQSSS